MLYSTAYLPDLFREGQGVVAHGRMGKRSRVSSWPTRSWPSTMKITCRLKLADSLAESRQHIGRGYQCRKAEVEA